jgi:type I restriction enzyme S subunit
MHDSGVEWIGEIPAHWEIKRAKYLFREVDERTQTGKEELLSVSHMTGVTPRSEKNVYMFLAEDYTGSKLCRKDDLVFNIMWAWMGALGVSDRTGIVSPSYGVYRQLTKGTFNAWFLENLLRSGQYVAEYNRRSTGLNSSRLRLYAQMFFAMELGFPSIEEQNLIEKKVSEKTKLIEKGVLSVATEIEKLQELRDILISNAVTGKIKSNSSR